ncbi:Rv1355c family protein [Dyadobacter crusticola]|uniref:Rv1355c family protein n=1 Tax=Dyadobacter crusticola TaxID=292407 RepID=UPI0004E18F2C|nr:Rv1355c family protein [Dyadobacter crusticola]
MHSESTTNTIHKPLFIPNEQYADEQSYGSFRNEYRNSVVLDLYASQAKELIKIQNPRSRLTSEQLDNKYGELTAGKNPDFEGCWLYYPWSNRLLHIVSEADFIALRTTRNQHKITAQEQASLSQRKIGIIGLSVGHAVALTLATERLFGKLKLADFDTLELSNLNRIRTGIHNIGLNKSIITAREIAEIDPFLDVECQTEGITSENLHDFLTKDGNLDLLIDECDDLEVKIKCRQAARLLQIPVVMETSDRGMLDVERFDLEPGREILHGMLSGIPPERLENIPPADRLGLVMRIIDVKNASRRGRASLLEVGQSISTWPQLASAVTLGGGVVTDVTRRILLGQFTGSGRFYVDLEQIIANQAALPAESVYTNPNTKYNLAHALETAAALPQMQPAVKPGRDEIRQIVEAGTQAPSWGNDQPWKWLYRNGRLHLFHDPHRSHAFINYKNTAAHFALGAAFTNIRLKSYALGYDISPLFFPASEKPDLIAVIDFTARNGLSESNAINSVLAEMIPERSTSRGAGLPFEMSVNDVNYLLEAGTGVANVNIDFIQNSTHISELAAIAGACELISILHDEGYRDIFKRNISAGSTENPSDSGHDLSQLAVDPAHAAALAMLRDRKIADILQNIDGGSMLAERIAAAVSASSGIAVISMPETGHPHFYSGMIAQEMWLRAMQLGLSAQPLFTPVSLFSRLRSGEGLNEKEIVKLNVLKSRFELAARVPAGYNPVALLRIHKSSTIATKSKRLPLDEVLFIVNDEI